MRPFLAAMLSSCSRIMRCCAFARVGLLTEVKLPLVIFSHGYKGWFGGHHDTAAALADAGFVVAAIDHSGDNGNDTSRSDELSSFLSRPADLVRLLDFVLKDWKDKAVVDPSKIGLFGFSKGGYTGLVLVGAAPDLARFARGCTDASKFCEQLRSADIPVPPQDARVLPMLAATRDRRTAHLHRRARGFR